MSEEWLSYLLAVAIILLFNFLINRMRARRHEKREQNGNPACRMVPDLERTHMLFDKCRQRLEYVGLTDLMLRDFAFQTKLTQAQCDNDAQAEAQLQSMLIEMLPHLHLLPNVKLLVTTDASKLQDGALGEYDHGQRTVRILLLPGQRSPELLASALCHECIHCFLYTYGISAQDPQLNEGLTEAMASLVGFSQIMIRANANRQLPYLNRAEFEELRKSLLEIRPQLQQQADQKRNLQTAREQLKKNLSGAWAMIEQAKAMIAVNKAPQSKRLSPAELRQLQQTLLALENGSYAVALRQAEKGLNGDLAAVRKADDSVLAICGRLYRLMLAFRA